MGLGRRLWRVWCRGKQLDCAVTVRRPGREEARAILCPSSLAGCVVHRFGAEGLAAREFISKQVPVVMRSWQRRFEGAILPGQFERAREHSAGKQDEGRGPCDDLRIHGRPPTLPQWNICTA